MILSVSNKSSNFVLEFHENNKALRIGRKTLENILLYNKFNCDGVKNSKVSEFIRNKDMFELDYNKTIIFITAILLFIKKKTGQNPMVNTDVNMAFYSKNKSTRKEDKTFLYLWLNQALKEVDPDLPRGLVVSNYVNFNFRHMDKPIESNLLDLLIAYGKLEEVFVQVPFANKDCKKYFIDFSQIEIITDKLFEEQLDDLSIEDIAETLVELEDNAVKVAKSLGISIEKTEQLNLVKDKPKSDLTWG